METVRRLSRGRSYRVRIGERRPRAAINECDGHNNSACWQPVLKRVCSVVQKKMYWPGWQAPLSGVGEPLCGNLGLGARLNSSARVSLL